MPSKVKFVKWPAVLAATLLVLTYFHWPYGYYVFTRFIVTAAALYYAYYLYKEVKKLDFWFWGLTAIIIIFNPIIPIYLYDKSIWWVIDGAVIVYLMSLIIKYKKL